MIRHFIRLHAHTKARWPRSSELVRYGISGGVGAVVDFTLYVILTRSFAFWRDHFLSANVFSFLFANVVTFLLHKYFSFNKTTGQIIRQYSRFVLVSLCYLGIVQGVLYVGVTYFHLHDLVAKITAQSIGTIWNYVANRFWSFRNITS